MPQSRAAILFIAAAAALLSVTPSAVVVAMPWSRSLPSGTQAGFPVVVGHVFLAQGAVNHTLFAFGLEDGEPRWSIPLTEPLFPFCLLFKGINGGGGGSGSGHNGAGGAVECDDDGKKLGVFQGLTTMYGIDLERGVVQWTVRGLSSPVFLPTPMEGSTQFDGILTALYVNATAPRCVAGIDVSSGRTAWVNCDHTVAAEGLQDGAPLPVIVTEKTFFGCFESRLDPHRSIVLERQLDDPVFPPHVFDFWPQTVMMTNTFGFITDRDNDQRYRGGYTVKRGRHANKHQNRDGQPIRVAFAVSGWDSEHLAYAGATTVVSVIAQAGMITWRRTLSSHTNQPIQFMVRHAPEVHEMIVTDSTSFIIAIATDSGTMMWNRTVNRTSTTSMHIATTSNNNEQHKQLHGSSAAGGIDVSLGPVTYVLQTRHHVFVSQHVTASSNPSMVDTTTDIIAMLDLFSGAFVSDALVVSSITSQFASREDVLYIPGSFEVAALNVTNMDMRSLYLTHSPVDPLFDVRNENRLVFGTAYTVYSFPLL